ncbi:hypothetical protein CONPUDRAFT_83304 [Coniophora puteana RWD-64-598 SS2]|uniref:Uncharacterized protein n=1 Tax=Coniophora puteana (strain RWD-64-598) TaxID=741705 RepID=A0A5M3MJC9_CONPW|nr:uncharacterized protein CONPUDRAFT_83304 [Coniophora puteana RWD-64-598 SS2]EIW78904.1 hypothetical protein CONPUDRAFT_83304 [Coniophora puteana RWD-64-598 SS2]
MQPSAIDFAFRASISTGPTTWLSSVVTCPSPYLPARARHHGAKEGGTDMVCPALAAYRCSPEETVRRKNGCQCLIDLIEGL